MGEWRIPEPWRIRCTVRGSTAGAIHLLVLLCAMCSSCIEIPPAWQNMKNPNSTRYEAECDCYVNGTSIMTKRYVYACDVPAEFVNESDVATRLKAQCDESDSQFTNCELNPEIVGSDGVIGCGSTQSCVPYGCCYAYGPHCSAIQCDNAVLLEDGDLNCLDSSSRVAPSAGPVNWSKAVISSGSLQISTPEGDATAQLSGNLQFMGGNCSTGTCPFELASISLGATAFDLQGHQIGDPFVINDTAASGTYLADASVFMIPAHALEIFATGTIEGQRKGIVADSDVSGAGIINQKSRQLVFEQSFSNFGDSIDIQFAATIDNLEPTVSLPASPVYECNATGGANVSIAAIAKDVDGQIQTTKWLLDGNLIGTNSTTLNTFLPLGAHSVSVAVFDNDGGMATAQTTVRVQDTTAPQVQLDPVCLWPPDHELFVVDASAIHVTDACDAHPLVTFMSGTSNQADNGTGDGNSTSDIVVQPGSVCVRAERSGNVLTGRVYSIVARARDASANAAQFAFDITVPHDQSGKCSEGAMPTNPGDPRCAPSASSVSTTASPPPLGTTNTSTDASSNGGCDSSHKSSPVLLAIILCAYYWRPRHRV